MPRFFFNILDGSPPDETGTELPDIHAARSEAVMLSGQLLREMGATFWDGAIWKLQVSDEQSNVLFTLTFKVDEPPGSLAPE